MQDGHAEIVLSRPMVADFYIFDKVARGYTGDECSFSGKFTPPYMPVQL
jgi:hypothetical protein